MTPVDFPERNTTFRPPPDMTEEQCSSVLAYDGQAKGGSCDGARIVVVAWKPTPEEQDHIADGKPIFLTMVGGLAPHALSTSFEAAITLA